MENLHRQCLRVSKGNERKGDFVGSESIEQQKQLMVAPNPRGQVGSGLPQGCLPLVAFQNTEPFYQSLCPDEL